jgi:phosphoribosylglycinamide formyltransferase-1
LNGRPSRRSVVILISGRGGNMRALIEQSRLPDSPYEVVTVFSDKAHAAGLELARERGVPARALPVSAGEERTSYDRRLADAVRACSPALIVLAGFMRILSAPFVAEFAGRVLNIHPSLLPKFPGLHTHRKVLEAGDSVHGVTVHFVTEELDGGPPVIQARIAVSADDDEAGLAAKIQIQEHKIYPLAVRWFCEGRLTYAAGQAWLDGHALQSPIQYDQIQ